MTGRIDGLAQALAAHVPFDAGERAAAQAILTLLVADRPFAADAFTPGHVTASAFVVHPERAAVALIFHTKLGRWLQPGGHVEPEDASVAEAALREAHEETGVVTGSAPWLFDVDVHVFPARGDTPRHLHHDVRFTVLAATDHLTAGDGVDEARWWSFEDALTLEESIARPVRKLMAVGEPPTTI